MEPQKMALQTPAADNNPPSLLSIPVEVLLNITYNLSTPEYGNLRLTCKQIEATLFPAFSKEFFSKKQFMFTEFSLQTLVDIAKSRLSSCLSHVLFGLERPSSAAVSTAFNPISLNAQPIARIQHNRLLQEHLSHIGLLNNGQDVEMLAEAFSSLTNLETIGLRDFNSRSRNRDYPNNQWRSYGVQTYLVDTGTQLASPQPGYTFPPAADNQDGYTSRIFLNLLRALGKSSSRPKRFQVILRTTSLFDHAFNIPKYVEPIVEPVLADLRQLFLDLNSNFPPAHVLIDNEPAECPSYLLRKFLSKVLQLEHLRLNFRSVGGETTNDVLTWLSKPVSVASSSITSGDPLLEVPPPIHLTKLQQLDIGMTTVEPKFLLALIQKYRATLRTISFHKISLLQSDAINSGEKINLWAKLFERLSKLDLKLSAINLSALSQEQTNGRKHRQVHFKDSRKGHNPRIRNWAGPDVQSGLRDFIQYTTVERLDYDSDASIKGSDEDDSDESMDDLDDIETEGEGDDDD